MEGKKHLQKKPKVFSFLTKVYVLVPCKAGDWCLSTGGWTGTYQATARNGARGKWHLLTPKYLEKIKSLFITKNGNRKGLGIRLL